MTDNAKPYFLAHTLYLDEDMMLSFLAHLEGGVATQEDEEETEGRSRGKKIAIRAGLRAKVFNFVNAEGSTEFTGDGAQTSTAQVKRSRHHTAASLFNLLYEYLVEDDARVEVSGDAGFGGVTPGSLVEFEGKYLGNPMEAMIDLMASFLPYMDPQDDPLVAQPKKSTGNGRSGNPAKRAASQSSGSVTSEPNSALDPAGVAIVRRMMADTATAPVHDLLVELTDGHAVVLVASSDYFSQKTSEMLRSGVVRVIGKVTAVLDENDSINLTRRTVLGAGGGDLSTSMLTDFADSLPHVVLPSPVVKAPALQVIPMAIFV